SDAAGLSSVLRGVGIFTPEDRLSQKNKNAETGHDPAFRKQSPEVSAAVRGRCANPFIRSQLSTPAIHRTPNPTEACRPRRRIVLRPGSIDLSPNPFILNNILGIYVKFKSLRFFLHRKATILPTFSAAG
ncbi:MAG: hypothetical protein IJJ28_06840, partial [Lentisphaeria bacterium]|nr:hypothetical protein [Lentisphaeria bacterium]